MFQSLSKLFDTNAKEVSKLSQIVDSINSLEPQFKKLRDKDISSKTAEFKLRLTKGETLDDILPEAFALVREASRRTLSQRHYDVQLMASIAFHQGKVAEQKTGEGKTLSATAALYLNSLSGHGAHLVTVNDYLAQRDAGWNGPLFHLLGVTVATIIHEQAFIYDHEYHGKTQTDIRLVHLKPVTRQQAYQADITYGTSNEFGFDYLRDNMAQDPLHLVQRGHNFAIVDEVDSILIDEARTPLIISAPDTEPTEKYVRFSSLVKSLVKDQDYEVDEKLRTATLTDYGVKRIEKMINVDNLYEKDYDTIHHVEQALKAWSIFQRDKDYVVKDDQVIIVDEHTGRLMYGRRYSDGLHQAIEAKEGVAIQRESKTLATISIQNYFRMYQKLSGMTGTAETEAEEFKKIYDLDVVVIPTNKPTQRLDHPDVVYKTTRAKFGAIVKEVESKYQLGQPVLLGTRSIEINEIISRYLKKKKIPHQILNAKQHQKEAQIIADAGKPHAVTVATNMAGRGVDIVLGGSPPDKPDKSAPQKDQDKHLRLQEKWQQDHQQVIKLGGLHVIGTERHESRRIDNQLRGRSGRQGDPGSSRFFIALDDEIMRIFGGERVANLMTALKIDESQPIEAGMVSKAIQQAQTKVEGFHFDQRKHLVEYDDVMNKQREIIYAKRLQALTTSSENLSSVNQEIQQLIHREIELAVMARTSEGVTSSELNDIVKEFSSIVPFDDQSQTTLTKKLSQDKKPDSIITTLKQIADDINQQRLNTHGESEMAKLGRFVILKTIDDLWIDHLDNIEDLREGIWLRGDKNAALSSYKKEAYELFERLINSIDAQVARKYYRVQISSPSPVSIDTSQILAHKPSTTDSTTNTSQIPQAVEQVTNNPFAAALAQSASKPISKRSGIKTDKVGRNDPCPCGAINPATGQVYKFKKCGLIGAPHHKA